MRAVHTIRTVNTVTVHTVYLGFERKTHRFAVNEIPAASHALAQAVENRHGLLPGDAGICNELSVHHSVTSMHVELTSDRLTVFEAGWSRRWDVLTALNDV